MNRRPEVWLVDDSALERRVAERAIGRDYQVKTFEDGSTLIEHLASENAPDLIVLDWLMPGVSGIEVCRYLRASEGPTSKISVLLLTAQRSTEQIVEGLEAGANDFLSKPYAPEELRARVRSLLRSRELLERAEEAEATVLELLDDAPDSLLVLDHDLRVTYANRESTKLFARSAASLLNQPVQDLIPGIDLETVSAEATVGTPVSRDLRINTRLLSPTLRKIQRRGQEQSIIALRDVTDQRHREARRLDFYAIIAHDLRTPLNVMMLRNELLLRGARGELPKSILDDFRKTQTNILAMVDLINDFLDFGRLDRDTFTITRARIDLREVVASSAATLSLLAEQKQIRIEQQAVPDGTIILGDVRRLSQVLINLIGNAIKFTAPGGHVRVEINRQPDQVEVAVVDTGRGISAEVLPTLFQRYVRATGGAQEVDGTGLGLMIVREIIEAHEGRVSAESTLGRGSRFSFWLPLAGA